MTRTFASEMPERPVSQEHIGAKRSDNFSFLRSLTGDKAADVNLRWFWNNPRQKTEESGGLAFGLHSANPPGNGYEHIMTEDGKRCRPMTPVERRRTEWKVADVKRWRRGPSPHSERPRSYWELCNYVREHGGTVVGEPKSWAFGQYPWIMREMVAKAKDRNHAPWFKGLPGKYAEEECANTIAAGGQYAIIFGKKVKGRTARLREAKKVTANWAVKPTAVW